MGAHAGEGTLDQSAGLSGIPPLHSYYMITCFISINNSATEGLAACLRGWLVPAHRQPVTVRAVTFGIEGVRYAS